LLLTIHEDHRYLIMTGKHATKHHEVGSSADGLGNVPRTGTPAILEQKKKASISRGV
jgi:hypothetical protein